MCNRVEFQAPSRAVYEITLLSFPMYPVMNNLYQHRGNPLASDFWCDSSHVTLANGEVSCAFESAADAVVREYAPCSNRGLCNDRIGVCTCDNGYYGEHCGSNKDEEDVLVAPANGPFFKGNVFRVSAKRTKSSEFNLIKADVEGRAVFSVDGNGDTALHSGSLVVQEGDVVVQSGQVHVRNGGRLAMDRADVHVKDAQVRVQQRTKSAGASALLLLELLVESTATDLMRLTTPAGPVFRVSGSGTTMIDDGGLEVLRGGVRVQRGGVHVLSDGVTVTNGAVNIQHGALNVHAGSLRVSDGHAAFAASLTSMPALDVSRQPPKTGSKPTATGLPSSAVLELHSTVANDTLICARGRHDVEVFEVRASGETVIRTGGLQVDAGGVRITSGGQTITSGGLHIESGGAVIDGELVTRGGLRIDDGGFSVQHSAANAAALSVRSTNPNFGGTLIAFDLSSQQQPSQSRTGDAPPPMHPFRLFEALDERRSASDARIISVDNRGNVVTQGDIATTHRGKIVSSGALVSEAQVVLGHANLVAGAAIAIPSSHSYVKITDDGEVAANVVTLDTHAAYAGQLLVIQNEDEQSLDGDVSVKPSSAAIFMFDGASWRALTAASFDTAVMTGVTHFEAANDLNVGDVKITAKSVQVASQRAGYVAIYSKGGELSQDDTLSFDAATGTLAVYKLRAEVIQGSIDMSESELRHVEIVGGHISNVNLTSIERMEVDGELFVELDAFFGSGITVDGQVMGSGAYVDASDARFKTDVAPIRDALNVVTALAGVTYRYRTADFPAKKFSGERELGFIAQQVEDVLPEVVSEDADGFKYVAYARIVPVVVEALKSLRSESLQCKDSIDALHSELSEMKRLLAQQQKLIDVLMLQQQTRS